MENITESADHALEANELEETQAKIAPPWIQYSNKIIALFGNDPEIKIEYSNDDVELKIRVANEIKADAIAKLLPHKKYFGNVTLTITIIPANDLESEATLYQNAFNGNPVFSFVYQQDPEGLPPFT